MAQQPRMGKVFHPILQSSLIRSPAQMKLLKTKHREAFNAAPDVDWPGIGWVRTVGAGAGDYTFVSIDDAGHCESPGLEHAEGSCIANPVARLVCPVVEWDRQEAFRDILFKWVKNESLVV